MMNFRDGDLQRQQDDQCDSNDLKRCNAQGVGVGGEHGTDRFLDTMLSIARFSLPEDHYQRESVQANDVPGAILDRILDR